MTACVVSTHLGSEVSPWGIRLYFYLCLYLLLQRTASWENKAELDPLTRDGQKDVYLILNAAHLVLQIAQTVLLSWSRNRDLNCFLFFRFLFVSTSAPVLSHKIYICFSRLSPAAWAPASSSPAALLPTRPPSVKRWRFTVCSSWISTPLKVRQPDVGFHLISYGAGAFIGSFWW